MSNAWVPDPKAPDDDPPPRPSELALQNLNSIREAALTLLREVESLRRTHQATASPNLDLHEEVQRYEIELIRQALNRTRGNQRRAAKLLGVKVTTLNCKIKRFGISFSEDEGEWSVLA
jgi:transcriptional regulator with PAS, ATPase and Fis domain